MQIQRTSLGALTLLFLPLLLRGDTSLKGEVAVGELKPSGRYESLGRAFRDAQLQVQRDRSGFRLQNPESGLDVEFLNGAVMAQHPEGRLNLRLEACGYGDHPTSNSTKRIGGSFILLNQPTSRCFSSHQ
jgi:hypothetical protein